MTFAQILLVPIGAALIIDVIQTSWTLRHEGYLELNKVSGAFQRRFGVARGASIYSALIFSIMVGLFVLFPTQWGLALILLVELLATLVRNHIATRPLRQRRA